MIRPGARGDAVLLRRVLPGTMFAREVLVTLNRPRALLIKMLFPLALALPLVAGHAPTFWAAMLLTVLCAMVGAVGAAMNVARARDAGLLTRLALSPRPAWRLMCTWVAGGAVIDVLQLAPAVVAVILLAPVTAGAALALIVSVIAVLVIANVLGFAVAAFGGGAGEVLLDSVVLLAPLLFLGGLFTGVPAAGVRAALARVDPFAYLHAAFIAALGGSAEFDTLTIVVAALVTVVVALALTAMVAPLVLRRR
jgi:ABC-2 type transport system permease protein